jgi:hypothetical protein
MRTAAGASHGREADVAETTDREQADRRQILVQISVPARYARRDAAAAKPAFHP